MADEVVETAIQVGKAFGPPDWYPGHPGIIDLQQGDFSCSRLFYGEVDGRSRGLAFDCPKPTLFDSCLTVHHQPRH